jgi:excisionase family DNA binding protein
MSTVTVASGSYEPLLLSRKQAAARLGLSVSSIDLLVKDGRLEHVKLGDRVAIPVRAVHQIAQTGVTGRIRPKRTKY